MDPRLLAMFAQAGGQFLGGMKAEQASHEDRIQATRLMEEQVKDLEAIGVPTAEAQRIILERLSSQGELTPELTEAIKLGDSNMLGVATDPAYKQAQLEALSQLQGLGASGGMTLADQANLERTLGNIRSQQKGARDAILQRAQMQSGGVGGASGTALAAQLQGAQDAAQMEHLAGLETAASARERALQAIMGAGQMGGSIRQQEFGELADKARAQDAIKAWNAANQQNVLNSNVGMKNYAQERNLGERQRIADTNVGLTNQQRAYNASLPQQEFQNRLNRAGYIGNARTNQANQALQNAESTSKMWSGIGNAVGQGAASYGSYQANKDWLNAYKEKNDPDSAAMSEISMRGYY